MSIKYLLLVCSAAVLLPTAGVAQNPSDEEAVGETVEAFHLALSSGDGPTALDQLGTEVRIFESGHAETREEYASGHLRGDMAFAAAVERTTTWSQVEVVGDVAVYLSQYETKGTFRDREIDSRGTETMVLVRSADGWKIRHIHWSSR